jgi:hypothetical protein
MPTPSFRALLALASLLAPATAPATAAETTAAALWASYAAAPDTHPLIPNCSYAGYHRGEAPLPEAKATLDLKADGGAKGDGKADDTAAFAAAIAKAGAAPSGGVIMVPAGTYRVDGMIRLGASRVVLRGAGAGETVIAFQKPLAEVVGARRSGTSSAWSWSGGLVWMGPEDVFAADGSVIPSQGAQDWEEWQTGERIAEVSAPAKRGARTVQVADASRLVPGSTVLMCWANPSDHSLLLAMAGHELMQQYPWDKSAGGLTGMKEWRWPVEIAAVDGHAVTLRQPLRLDVRPEWAVGFTPLGRHVEESGLERLTLRMPPHQAAKHLADTGYNGVYLDRCLHCWVRDVTIENPDNGVIHAASKNTTVTGLVITGGPHHHATALRVGSHDNLISDFRILSQPKHGINTEYLSTGNVWRRGVMAHGTFDSHRAMSFDLIRTDITVVNDGTPGGGGQAGPFLGAHVVHWNIRVSGKGEFINQPDCLSLGALVGIQGVPLDGKEGWAMAHGDKGVAIADQGTAPAPADLYAAQLALRLGTTTRR